MKESRYKIGIFLIILLLVLVTLSTSYYGSTDTGDYADAARYFAGDYSAKIRSSHSYLLGFIHAPFVNLFDSLIALKISSLIFLLLIIYSIYSITGKNKKVLWLALLSPILWYMAPWASPIQIASLCIVWAYHFINKYDKTGKLSLLAYSGILIGLAWAFWDTIWIFGGILGLVFLFNKKLSHSIFFSAFVCVGLLPRLV